MGCGSSKAAAAAHAREIEELKAAFEKAQNEQAARTSIVASNLTAAEAKIQVARDAETAQAEVAAILAAVADAKRQAEATLARAEVAAAAAAAAAVTLAKGIADTKQHAEADALKVGEAATKAIADAEQDGENALDAADKTALASHLSTILGSNCANGVIEQYCAALQLEGFDDPEQFDNLAIDELMEGPLNFRRGHLQKVVILRSTPNKPNICTSRLIGTQCFAFSLDCATFTD